MEHLISLEPGKYYHIYNRGIAGANVFLEDRNYAYFMSLYTKHVAPLAATYAYVLLRNHFHLFIRVLEPRETFEVSETSKVLSATQAFSNFFNAYAKAINKTYGRTGSLFAHRFRRIEIDSELYGMR